MAGSLGTTFRVLKALLWCNLDSTSVTKRKVPGQSRAAFKTKYDLPTNTIIHKLTELFTKASAMRYFYRNLKSPAYG